MQVKLDIPDTLMAQLDDISVQRKRSREELLQEAIDLYLARQSHLHTGEPYHARGAAAREPSLAGVTPSPITDTEERERIIQEASGSLPYLGDGLLYQEQVRNEWVREWDPEYDPRVHG